jgi:DNA-binding transcriptional regulator YhcF (GntR family)
MLIVVDPHSGIPVYRQLMDQIRFHANSGLLEPGDELPSTRALSAELGINPMTVSKAYALLERDGVLERRPGLPLIVASMTKSRRRQEKREQLRRSLGESVAMARQLGMSEEEALSVMRQLLREREGVEVE